MQQIKYKKERTLETIRTVCAIKLANEIEFRQIFDDYDAPLSMFSNLYVEDSAVAADIAQDCFVKLWQLRTDFFLSASGGVISLYGRPQ